MGNNRAGTIIHRYKVAQDKIDEAIDRKFDKEAWGGKIPKPFILPNGAKLWTFGGEFRS